MKNRYLPKKEAKTRRGKDVRTEIYKTVRRLLQDQWIKDISIKKLTEEAQLSRASFSLQFPMGWSDVAFGIFYADVFEPTVDLLWDDPETGSSQDKPSRVFGHLEFFVKFAEQSGLLLQNLRAQMFTWGEENDMFWRMMAQDWATGLAGILADDRKAISAGHHTAAETLIISALDLAAGGGLYDYDGDQIRDELRRHIGITIAGLRTIAAKG